MDILCQISLEMRVVHIRIYGMYWPKFLVVIYSLEMPLELNCLLCCVSVHCSAENVIINKKHMLFSIASLISGHKHRECSQLASRKNWHAVIHKKYSYVSQHSGCLVAESVDVNTKLTARRSCVTHTNCCVHVCVCIVSSVIFSPFDSYPFSNSMKHILHG